MGKQYPKEFRGDVVRDAARHRWRSCDRLRYLGGFDLQLDRQADIDDGVRPGLTAILGLAVRS